MTEETFGGSAKWRLSAYLFLVTATFGFLQPFLPLYMETVGLTRGQIGFVTGFGSALALIIQPLVGRLSDHWDARRPFIVAAALAAAFAYLSLPNARGFNDVLLLNAVGANGTAYLMMVGGVLVGRMVANTSGGATYASFRVWGSVGYIVVSLLSGLLVFLRGPIGSSRQVLDPIFHYGPLLFVGIAVLAFFLPDRKRDRTPEERPQKAPLTRNLAWFLLAYFLYTIALYGSSPYLSIYMKSLGATGLWITGMFAGGVVVEVLVMRRSGVLSDIYGRRPALALSFLLLPVRLLLYVPATGPLWVAMVQTLHGVNFGIVGAVAVAFANDLASEGTHGRAQARLAAVSGLAMAIGPFLLGSVSDAWGLRMMFVAAAGVAALAAVVLLLGVEDSHPSSHSIGKRISWLHWLDAPPRRRK